MLKIVYLWTVVQFFMYELRMSNLVGQVEQLLYLTDKIYICQIKKKKKQNSKTRWGNDSFILNHIEN